MTVRAHVSACVQRCSLSPPSGVCQPCPCRKEHALTAKANDPSIRYCDDDYWIEFDPDKSPHILPFDHHGHTYFPSLHCDENDTVFQMLRKNVPGYLYVLPSGITVTRDGLIHTCITTCPPWTVKQNDIVAASVHCEKNSEHNLPLVLVFGQVRIKSPSLPIEHI